MTAATLSRRLLMSSAATCIAMPAWAAHHHIPAKPADAKPAPAAASPDDDTGGDATDAASAATTPLGPLDTVAKQGCIIDFNTGATLLDKQADAPMVPSSLTKLMTAYLVFQTLAAGKLTLVQQLPVSEKAWRMGGSKMFVPYPGAVTVEDLIRGMITQSGNDACIVLAEGISGSEDQFVARMNDTAGKLGLAHSTFRNCTGWPDPDHRMSPRDIATLAHHLIADYPQYYHYFGEKDYAYDNIKQANRNILVDHGIADGLKTGHTQDGGFGECASADRNGRRVIVVLNGMASMKERARESERMLDWAFASFENVTLLTKGQVIDHLPVWLGTAPSVTLIGSQTTELTLPRAWKQKAKVELRYDSPVRAPLRAGDTLGQMLVSGDGVPSLQLALVAADSVDRLGFASRAATVLSHLVTGA